MLKQRGPSSIYDEHAICNPPSDPNPSINEYLSTMAEVIRDIESISESMRCALFGADETMTNGKCYSEGIMGEAERTTDRLRVLRDSLSYINRTIQG